MESKPTFATKRILIGYMSSSSLINYVKNSCIEEDIKRLPEILEHWRQANSKFLSITQNESRIAESIELKELDPRFDEKVRQIRDDPYFRSTFENFDMDFKLVEIGKMIAFQGGVDLNYIDMLNRTIQTLDEDVVFDLCLPLKKEHVSISEVKSNEQQYTFTSENVELRYLGAVSKDIEEVDLKYSSGGVPIKGIMLLVGFGAMRANALLVKNKILLRNGFHRIFYLYSKGVRHVPIALQRIKNPEFEFPEMFLGAPRDYALNAARPPIIRDYFDPDLTMDLRVKPLRKGVKLSIISEDFIVPV